MKKLCSKFLTFSILIFHPNLKSHIRYFLRFYYLGHLNQLKYLFADLIKKTPYKEIRFYGEFQQELLYAIPYAYWHYKNGTLKKTISSKDTKELYYFSPEHDEVYVKRKWRGNFSLEIPHAPHNHRLCMMRWAKVPYKEIYSNSLFIFDKPILIIANQYHIM